MLRINKFLLNFQILITFNSLPIENLNYLPFRDKYKFKRTRTVFTIKNGGSCDLKDLSS